MSCHKRTIIAESDYVCGNFAICFSAKSMKNVVFFHIHLSTRYNYIVLS